MSDSVHRDGGAYGLRVERESYRIASAPRNEVLRYLGYKGQELTPELDRRLDEVMARCVEVARPVGALRSYPVRSAGEECVALEGTALTLTGVDIARHLSDASEVVLMAVTLGAAIDRELRLLSLTDPVSQVMFDACATALAERAADAAEAHARAYASERGGFASWRFSPGYGDFPLETQRPFLATMDATRRLGITLTPSNLMVPTKSVTAVVGVHATPQAGMAESCAICSLSEFCALRKGGVTCRGEWKQC